MITSPWSINQKILDGTSSIYSRPCYGYRKSEDGSLLIVPEEAETVRLIFNLYLSGYSIIGIIHELESRSISSPTGKPKWCRRAIDTLLSNEKYRGGSTQPQFSERRCLKASREQGICFPIIMKQLSTKRPLLLSRKKNNAAVTLKWMKMEFIARKPDTQQKSEFLDLSKKNRLLDRPD